MDRNGINTLFRFMFATKLLEEEWKVRTMVKLPQAADRLQGKGRIG